LRRALRLHLLGLRNDLARPRVERCDLAFRQAALSGERGEVRDPAGSRPREGGRSPLGLRFERLNLTHARSKLQLEAAELRPAVACAPRRVGPLLRAPLELVEPRHGVVE
jgi:hypothetical protein